MCERTISIETSRKIGTSYYQRTLYALKEAVTVEYMVNQMNYLYAAATETSNYYEAQKQLTTMYAF